MKPFTLVLAMTLSVFSIGLLIGDGIALNPCNPQIQKC